eukprot:8935107-Lingulodinium_polyedra.AAC.1
MSLASPVTRRCCWRTYPQRTVGVVSARGSVTYCARPRRPRTVSAVRSACFVGAFVWRFLGVPSGP